MMEAVTTSEMLENFYDTTRYSIQNTLIFNAQFVAQILQ
jgi:hypothetical protein